MTILTTNSVSAQVPLVPPVSAGSTQRIRNIEPASAAVQTTEAASPPVQAQAATIQLEQVQSALARLKQSIKPALANSLEFQIDQSTGKTLVKILDTETNTVVRQIPSEELLIIARALDQMQGRGGLVQQEA
jgi:flagellar protein FlaG